MCIVYTCILVLVLCSDAGAGVLTLHMRPASWTRVDPCSLGVSNVFSMVLFFSIVLFLCSQLSFRKSNPTGLFALCNFVPT